MILSILIATTIERKDMFTSLLAEFNRQKVEGVEVFYLQDNKEISIGLKRQRLLEMAKGEYIVYFDDDDYPKTDYVALIMNALKSKPDCLGYKILMTTNGKNQQVCCHSLKYKDWQDKKDGYDFVRNVTHFNVVKRELAIKAGGFKDMRFGEDKDYAYRVTPLCKTEVFIDEFIFHYRYSNKENHKRKYGIK